MTAVTLTLWWPDRRRPPQASAAGALLAVSACFWPVGLPVLVVFLLVLAVRRAGWRGLAPRPAAAAPPLAGRLAPVGPPYPRAPLSHHARHPPRSPPTSLANRAAVRP